MKERKLIEKIWELVKDCENKDYSDESYMLNGIKNDLEKFIIMYEYFDKYGIKLKFGNIRNRESITIDEKYANIYINKIKGTKESRSYILNSDEQPNNELLMSYRHSTGSYMFGGGGWGENNYYDPDLFEMYFEELKKYKYKYIDDINHHLYFDLEEGFKLFKEYPKICEKYQKLFDERRKKAKIDKLKKELDNLEKKENNL